MYYTVINELQATFARPEGAYRTVKVVCHPVKTHPRRWVHPADTIVATFKTEADAREYLARMAEVGPSSVDVLIEGAHHVAEITGLAMDPAWGGAAR